MGLSDFRRFRFEKFVELSDFISRAIIVRLYDLISDYPKK